MKELFAPKHMKLFVGIVILAICTETVFLYIFISKKTKLAKEVSSKTMEVDRLLRAKDSPRREDNIALKNMIITVDGKNKDIVNFAKGKVQEIPVLSPLEFKEELEKTESVVKKNAGFPLPEGIGFKEYRGGVIPEASEVDLLTKQLFYTKEILELLINANVVTVEDIEWYEDIEEDMISSNYLLELSFVGNTDALIKFMVNLRKTKTFMIVHKLSVKRLENLKLLIKINLKVVDFSLEEKDSKKDAKKKAEVKK